MPSLFIMPNLAVIAFKRNKFKGGINKFSSRGPQYPKEKNYLRRVAHLLPSSFFSNSYSSILCCDIACVVFSFYHQVTFTFLFRASVTCPQFSDNGSPLSLSMETIAELTNSTDLTHLHSSDESESKSDWIEPAPYVYYPDAMQSQVWDAFRLLQIDPSVQVTLIEDLLLCFAWVDHLD